MTEQEFTKSVVEYARLAGWLVFHVNDSRREVKRGGRSYWVGDKDAAGFPDLILVHARKRRFLARELKLDAKRSVTTAEQDAWVAALLAAGVDAGVWRPSDWPAIQQTLSGARQEAA